VVFWVSRVGFCTSIVGALGVAVMSCEAMLGIRCRQLREMVYVVVFSCEFVGKGGRWE
jgi:hypothetical protein